MPGPAWTRRQRLERGTVLLASAWVRAAWLAPAVRAGLVAVGAPPRAAGVPAWLVAALLSGGSAARAATSTRRHPRVALLATALAAAALVGAAWGGARPAEVALWGRAIASGARPAGMAAGLALAGAAASAWLWGAAVDWADHRALLRDAVVGMVGLGTLLSVADAGTLWHAGLDPVRTALGYAASCVVGLSLVAAHRAGALGARHRPDAPGLHPQWLAALVPATLICVAAGWAAARVDLAGGAHAALGAVGRARYAAGEAVLPLLDDDLLPFVDRALRAVHRLVFRPASEMRDWLRAAGTATWSFRPWVAAPEPFVRLAPPGPDGWRPLLRGITVLGTAAAGAALLWRVLRRDRASWTATRPRRRGILERVARCRPAAPETGGGEPGAGVGFADLAGEEAARRDVRLLYRRLLGRLRALGVARPPSATPSAYAARVAPHLGAAEEDLRALTRVYLVARYSPRPPLAWDVEVARASLARIEAALEAVPEPDRGATPWLAGAPGRRAAGPEAEARR